MSTAAASEFEGLARHTNAEKKSHPEDLLAGHPDSDNSSDSDSSTTLHPYQDPSYTSSKSSMVMPAALNLPASSNFDANTGPKGVIADARSFETARKKSVRQTFYALADARPFKKLNTSYREASKSPSPDLLTDGEDDDFMRQWRQKRLDELSTTKHAIKTRRQSPSKRHFGNLDTVDAAGYLDAVEKVGAETVVVVLIYDDKYNMSHAIENTLRQLASKYLTTRFVRLHYREAEMDEIAVPGVLAYKGGDCIANLVSFLSEIPSGKDMDAKTVEEVLQRYKILT